MRAGIENRCEMPKRGPKTPEGKARSLANLKPPWEPGNLVKGGRPSAGLSIKEWVNQMEKWPRSKLEAVMKDLNAPVAKIAAARIWIDASSKERNSAGMPIAGSDVDRIFDRTEGKPKQAVELTGADGGPLEVKHEFDWNTYRAAKSTGLDAGGRVSPAENSN